MSKSTSKLFEEGTTVNTEEKSSVLTDTKENTSISNFPSETTPVDDDDIQDIEFSVVRKQRFRFNHDNSMILELNVSDMNIFTRLEVAYKNLNTLMDKVASVLSGIPDDSELTEDNVSAISSSLKELDENMRKELDYLFDAPVSEVLGRDGSMYDPIDGMFRYEHIIDVLSEKYENHLSNEFAKMRAMKENVERRTSKYTKRLNR